MFRTYYRIMFLYLFHNLFAETWGFPSQSRDLFISIVRTSDLNSEYKSTKNLGEIPKNRYSF